MKMITWILWFAAGSGLFSMCQDAEAAQRMRVTGQNVNLRAGPGLDCEVVAQASKNDILNVGPEDAKTNWVCVLVPENVDVWVHGSLVGSGVVTAPNAQVRGGPGINYRVIGRVEKGDKVRVRGQWQDWLKIVPPPGSYLWISDTYVVPADTSIETAVQAAVVSSTNGVSVAMESRGRSREGFPPRPEEDELDSRPGHSALDSTVSPNQDARQPMPLKEDRKSALPIELADRDLVPGVLQGRSVVYQGVLRSSGLIWQKTGEYRLVGQDEKGRAVTLCYVMGHEAELGLRVGKPIQITGREYWIQGVRFSVVLVSETTSGE